MAAETDAGLADLRERHPLMADVLAALALGALPRQREWVREVMHDPALRPPGSTLPTHDQVRDAIRGLRERGLVREEPRRPGHWVVELEAVPVVYDDLLRRQPLAKLLSTLARADRYDPNLTDLPPFARFPSAGTAVAHLRLAALAGADKPRLDALLNRLPYGGDVETVVEAALGACVDDRLLPRLHPSIAAEMLASALASVRSTFRTGGPMSPVQVRNAAHAVAATQTVPETRPLRWAIAFDWLESTEPLRRDADWIASFERLLRPVLDDIDTPADVWPAVGRSAAADAVVAAAHAQAGRWSEAETRFDAAYAALRKALGKRRSLLPPTVLLTYVLALLAQRTPAHLDKALKFCLAEGGSREPALDTPFGVVALAIQMRLGAASRDINKFRPYAAQWGYRGDSVAVSPLDVERWLMRAWLKEGAIPEPLAAEDARAAQRLVESLRDADLRGRAAQVEAALGVLGGETAPAWFFVPPALERWQSTLSALRAIGEPAPGAAEAAADTRIVWVLELGAHGTVRNLEPYEQKRGVRGWGKPKEVPLLRLQRGAATLAPRDAPVAAAISVDRGLRFPRLDLARAVGALIGHPHVAFDGAPETFVELVEGSAELEVIDQGERLRVRITPPLSVAPDQATPRWAGGEEDAKALAALRLVSVWPDGPQRARVIRLTDAQKRVAQLLGTEGLELPRAGAAQLQEVLGGLGGHFRVHADEAAAPQAARELPAETRLRAELQPVGDGLQLRLVAAPFGAEYAGVGPRLVPGRGRARVVALLGGERLGVQRDLAREREHLESLLEALPMLVELPPDAPCEWLLESPDDALALVERLQPHHAIAALDWPQGRPVRVATGALDGLTLKVRTHEDWLGVQGELKVDEELVVGLQQLIGFAASSRSRFMPLGDGRYLALTLELRERVADLAVVAESRTDRNLDELRLPAVAAPWLQAASEGARVEHDAAYAARLQALDDARRIVPALPSTLQAELRPYQQDGFEWAMRLAAAGLGACLADDMGLGKTLQALAVLLARAANGPALVVVPTSLVGNWRAEAARFAPALRVHVYAEQGGARAGVIETLGAHDMLVVSYALLQIDGEAFAARTWATLVLDEAQAIKNAAAKRSQAVFALRAAFRLAMSGTPIENRLGELWSVMRACNPGLLGSAQRFNERFANLIERQSDRAAQRTLKRLIAPFILRRTKAEVLSELPPRTELVLRVQGDEAEQAHYEALRREALVAAEKSLSGDGAGQAHLNILAGLTRLRRAACDPRLVTPAIARAGAKVQAFGELAAELVANGHKALVFSQFVDFLGLLREPLDAAGIAYQYLDGATPSAERTRRVDAFQAGEGHLFLISLKAGGFGLNLTVADYVVIADPWWNPAAEDQASGRAHRIGQQRPVTVYRLVHQGTLEEKILALHQTKRELADSVLEDEGRGAASLPMARELLALMRGDELPEDERP